MKRLASRILLAGIALFTAHTGAQAAVILTVDISDLQSIKFTATGAAASLTNADIDFSRGITLLGLFEEASSTGIPAKSLATNDLFAKNTNDGITGYATAIIAEYSTGGKVDLNFIAASGKQSFTTASAALQGQTRIDLFLADELFKSIGTIGDIVLSNNLSHGQGLVIGQYQIIPEPSSLVLMGVSSIFVISQFRRRSKALGSR